MLAGCGFDCELECQALEPQIASGNAAPAEGGFCDAQTIADADTCDDCEAALQALYGVSFAGGACGLD